MSDEVVNKEMPPSKPKSSRNKIIIGIVGVIALCCCGVLAFGTYLNSTPEGQATATAKAKVQEEQATRAEQTAVATIEATEEAHPTDTPLPIATPEPTVDTSGCTLGAAFQADVTIPDNTRIEVGQRFVKTWRIRNTGTCDWGTGYRLTFIDGDQMGGPDSVSVPETPAGENAQVSVELVAPMEGGQYRGSWQICVNQTECFGDRVRVQIVSVAPTPAPAPEVLAYFEATDEILLEKTVELAAVGELLESHAANPAVYYSQDWYDAMEYHILGWYEHTDQLQLYEPIPAAVSEYHEELVLMVAHEDEAQDYLLLWIDTPDARSLEQATAHIEAANEHMETAQGLRESLGY